MQTIDTGYKPEFGLGAFFSGQNAANAEAANQEELIKQFLANQQSRQMNPLEVQAKQLSLDPMKYDSQMARAKMADPKYIPAMMRGNMGQMASQEAAGNTALSLQPFKEQAEKAALENSKTSQGFQWTINDLNQKISQGGDYDEAGNLVKATPTQMAFFQKKKDELTKLLAESPEYMQKDMLKDQQYAAQLAAQESKNALAQQLAEQRHADALAKSEGRIPRTLEEDIVARIRAREAKKDITTEQALQELSEAYAGKNKNTGAAGMGITVGPDGKPMLQAVPSPSTWKPTATTAPQGMTIDKLRSMYPGMSDDKLRAAYKTKFGEDIK